MFIILSYMCLSIKFRKISEKQWIKPLNTLVENPARILKDLVFYRILHRILAGLHNKDGEFAHQKIAKGFAQGDGQA